MSFGGGGVGLEDAAKGAVLPVHFAWQGRFCSESSPGWWNTPQHTGSSSASSAQDDLKEVIFQSLDLKKKKKKIKSPSLRIFPCSYLPYSSIHFLKGKCSYCLPPSIWHWPRKLRALATPQDVFHLNIIFRSWGDKICLFDNREEEIISLGKNLFCLKISIGGELNVKMSYFFNGTNGYFYQRLFFESLSPVSFFFILRKKK